MCSKGRQPVLIPYRNHLVAVHREVALRRSLYSDGGGSRPDLVSGGMDLHVSRSSPRAARTFLSASVSCSRDGHILSSTLRGSALSSSATFIMVAVRASNSLLAATESCRALSYASTWSL